VAVVGGGIAGLSAALALHQARPDLDVVVLEASSQVGGKLRGSEVGGLVVDEGADSMLTRVPDGAQLARDAGLADELVAPASGAASVWTRGRLRPLPTGHAARPARRPGRPGRSEVLSARGLWRVPLDLALPGAPVTDDVGRRARHPPLGREVVERLVDPLLGRGLRRRADDLSLQATRPQLVGPVPALARCCWPRRPPAPPRRRPTGRCFAACPGGLGRLPAPSRPPRARSVRTARSVRASTARRTGLAAHHGVGGRPVVAGRRRGRARVPSAPPRGRLLAPTLPRRPPR
jgi:oxygen-dependent protoporphyrinogen oxidase